jgi:signal transduction histidine kinase
MPSFISLYGESYKGMNAPTTLLTSGLGSPPPRRVGHRAIASTRFVQLAAVFLAYFEAGKLGQATTNIRSSNLGPVWPAYGIALAACLAYDGVWPAIAVSAFLVAQSAVTVPAAIGQSIGAATAALSGAFLLRRLANFDPSLSKLRDALGLIVIGAFGSALISSSIGIVSLYAAGIQPYTGIRSAWLIYWLGDSTGVLLVTPLVFTISELLRLRSRARILELGLLLVLLTGACFVIFGDLPLFPIRLHVLAFAVLPFVMWGAIDFGIAGASLSVVLIASLATVLTAVGSGPFASNSPFVNAALLDVLFAVLAITGLTLAAVIAEREHAESARDRQKHVETALSTVNRKLIQAQEEERRRIARDLHDDIGQRLALLASSLSTVEVRHPETGNIGTNDLHATAAKLAEDVQALSHELHSSRVALVGIAASTKQFCAEFARQHGVEVGCDVHDVPEGLSSDTSLCLYRILQEALHNALKHSRQRRFDVHLWSSRETVHLEVRDYGVGFDVSASRMRAGIGLISMEERARLVGGNLTVQSAPQRGTTVHLSVPVRS